MREMMLIAERRCLFASSDLVVGESVFPVSMSMVDLNDSSVMVPVVASRGRRQLPLLSFLPPPWPICRLRRSAPFSTYQAALHRVLFHGVDYSWTAATIGPLDAGRLGVENQHSLLVYGVLPASVVSRRSTIT